MSNDEIKKSIGEINKLQQAITQCFNPKIGTLDLAKFNNVIKQQHISLNQVNSDWGRMGVEGRTALNSLVTSLTTINKSAITANTTLSKIANTFGNTVRWGITASIVQGLMNSVQGAVSYMKDLDKSLTNIQMVTGQSKEDMRELAQYANNAAQALGSTTTDYTNAVKVFVQEGYSTTESKEYANLSTKLANVSEQDTATTSDQITAYRNAFQLDYQQTAEAMDKVASVANNTASNVNELMTASQRAASVAQSVGASQDSFLASIATIESVTRQTPEEIGNGLKTIYQRFADITNGKSTEDNVNYGQYAEALKSIGVDILDAEGKFKGFDNILGELQGVWKNLSDTQKIAVGEKVAGKFQYNRFAALMNNPDYYKKAYDATQDSSGMMDQMNDTYVQGIQGRLNTLQAAGEQVMTTLFNQDTVEPILGHVTDLVNLLNNLVSSLGGGMPTFTAISAIMLRTFSPNIAEQAQRIATNIQTSIAAMRTAKELPNAFEQLGITGDTAKLTKTASFAEGNIRKFPILSSNTQQVFSKQVEEMAKAEDKVLRLEEQKQNMLKENDFYYTQQAEELKDRREAIEKSGDLTDRDKQRIAGFEAVEQKLRNRERLNKEDFRYLKESKQEFIAYQNAVDEINTKLTESNQVLSVLDQKAKNLTDRINTEALINRLTKGLSAVTSLAFAWQSFQSLGSLWKNDDLSLGEKIGQTILNLSMTIPMVVTGIHDLKKAIQELKDAEIAATAAGKFSDFIDGIPSSKKELKDTVGKLSSNKTKGAKNAAAVGADAVASLTDYMGKTPGLSPAEALAKTFPEVTNGLKNMSAGASTFSTAISKAGTALKAFMSGLGPLGLALGAAAVAFGIATEKANKQAQFFKDQLESSNSAVESIKSNSDSYDSALAAYEKTGNVTEELKTSSLAMADALGISGAKALVNAGNFSELSKQIAEARKQELEYNAILNAQKAKSLEKDYSYNLSNDIKNEAGIKTQETDSYTGDASYQFGTGEITSGSSNLEQAAALIGVVKKYQQEIADLNKEAAKLKIDGSDQSDYQAKQQEIAEKTKQLQEVQSQITDNNINDQMTAYKQAAESSLQAMKSGGDFDNLTASEARDKLLNDVNIKNEIDAIKSEALASGKTQEEGQKAADDYVNGLLEELGYRKKDVEGVAETLFDTPDTTDLKNAADRKSTLNDLVTSYQKNGSFTEDEVANILTEHPEYIGYLEKVGDAYKLNEQALSDWNDASKAQSEELDKIMDSSFNVLNDENRALKDSKDKFGGSFGQVDTSWGTNLDLDKTSQDIMNLNTSLANGQSSVKEYADGIGEVIDELNSLDIGSHLDDLSGSGLDTTEIEQLSASWERVGSSIADVTQKMTMQFRKGEISLSDYLENFAELGKQSNKVQQGLGKIRKEGNKWVAVTKEGADETNKANESLAEQANQTEESAEGIEELSDTYKIFEDKNEELQKWFGKGTEGSLIDFSAIKESGDEYKQVMSDIAYSTADFYQNNEQARNALSESLQAAANGNQDLIAQASQAVTDLAAGNAATLANLVAEHGEMAGAMVANTLAATNSQVAAVSSGIQGMVAGVSQIVSGLKFTISGEQSGSVPIHGTLLDVTGGTGILGGLGNLAGSLPYSGEIPTLSFGVNVEDNGSGSVQSGANMIAASGVMSGLFGGDNTASLDDFAPKSARVASPSSFGGSGGSGGGRGGGGGGGRGGGGGGSEKDVDPKDLAKSSWDYLKDITNDLDRASAVMDILSSLEDRLYGKDRLDNLAQLKADYADYIDLLEEELKLQKEHANILKNQDTDENGNTTIRGYANKLGMNLQFDSTGNIDNGRQLEQAALSKLNAAIEEYNVHRNEDDTSAYEKNIDSLQKDYDGLIDALDDYHDTLGKIEDTEKDQQEYLQKIQDATDEMIEVILDGFDDMQEAMDSSREFNKEYADFINGKGLENRLRNAIDYNNEGLANLFDKTFDMDNNGENDTSLINATLNNLKDRISDFEDVFDVLGEDNLDADHEALSQQDALDRLRDSVDKLTDELDSAVDYYNELVQTMQDAIEGINDLIDERQESYDNITDYLDTRLDQVELLFGENSYSDQIALRQTEQNAYAGRIATDKAALAAQQKIIDSLEALKIHDSELSQAQEDASKDAKERITDLQKDILDTESSSLENLQAIKEAQVNQSTTEMIGNLFSGADVDWVQQQWELATQNSEQYLDDMNRAYEIQKLQYQYQQLLNNTAVTSLNTQQKISDQMAQQLKYLRNKTNLSDYDVQYAQAQLEILQKQIALEEARDNKSQMRLQRNAAGNYDFVYAADENSVNQAESDLLDANKNAYNLSKDAWLNTYSSALDAAQKAKSMIVEIATNTSLSVDEQNERIQYILKNLKDYMDGASTELGEIAANLYNDVATSENLLAKENLGNLEQTFENMKDKSFNLLDTIDERFSLSIQNILTDTATINSTIDAAFLDIKSYLVDYGESTKDILSQAGDSFDSFTQDSVEAAQQAIQGMTDDLDTFKDSLDSLNYVFDASTTKIMDWGGAINTAMENAKSYIHYANELEAKEAAKQAALAAKERERERAEEAARNAANGGGSGGGGGGKTAGATTGFHGWYYSDSWGARPSGHWHEGQANAVRISRYSGTQIGGSQRNVGSFYVHLEELDGSPLGWVKPEQLFKTGGYTGDWTNGLSEYDNGKLAVLHQKELVLNSTDTANMLSAVELVRDLVNAVPQFSTKGIPSLGGNDTIEQRVEINATFPGVTDVEDIKQALMGLADNAYQLAGRQ